MMRFLFWLLLLVAMVYAAMLVRDGQTTLFGPPPPMLKALLAELPLPVLQPPPPPPARPLPDLRLVRRLAALESAANLHQEAWQKERQELVQQLADLSLTVANQGQKLALMGQSRLLADNGQLHVRWDDGGWRLEDYFAKRRVWSQRVDFAAPFLTPPRVVLGMTRIETGPEGSIEVQSGDVDSNGFTLFINAEEGRPREVKMQWLALGDAAIPQ